LQGTAAAVLAGVAAATRRWQAAARRARA
jgi:hypothetical protein